MGPLVLSGPAHPIFQGLFLDPCRPWYVSTYCFGQKTKRIDHLFNLPASLENLLGIYSDLLVIVNTTHFRLILGLLRGYKY